MTMFPRIFLGDVFVAGYLINCMPSFVLNDQISHSVLYPKSPLHIFLPLVFGSTCFVHNLSPRVDKLSAKSLKCIFQVTIACRKDIVVFLLLFDSISFLLMSHSLSLFPIFSLLTLMLICGAMSPLVLLITSLFFLFLLILKMNLLSMWMFFLESQQLHNPFKSIIGDNNQQPFRASH